MSVTDDVSDRPGAVDRVRWHDALEQLGVEAVQRILEKPVAQEPWLEAELSDIGDVQPYPQRRFVLAWLAQREADTSVSTGQGISISPRSILFAAALIAVVASTAMATLGLGMY
jgi:hypothetical protein